MPPSFKFFALLALGLAAGLVGCAAPGVRSCTTRQYQPLAHFVAAPAGDDDYVDASFRACLEEWQESSGEPSLAYSAAVWQLLEAACQRGRLDPVRGLTVRYGNSTFTVPVEYCGFAWQANDFQWLHLPPQGKEPLLQRRYHCAGFGWPLVVERCRRVEDPLEARFYPERSFFAATVALEFGELASADPAAFAASAQLKFYNPLQVRRSQSSSQPLATDLSAPLAVTLQAAPRTYFAGLIDPGNTQPRLTMLEPYQPGKIPLILIHGLFSDPQSWADMINDLRAAPGFAQRYQLWVFRYPTGRGFLQSATALRTELRSLLAALDPAQQDPALQHLVLVGHSMGGLIAKLQVTHSDELIWNELANRPLETIATTEQTRGFLAENCYFDPSPNIDRVIFIASPHAGSVSSSGLIGRGASLLVETPPEQAALHEQLIRDNPDTFNPFFERRLPTSIDMLQPQSPLLTAMSKMRLKPCLTLHNVIGAAVPLSLDGPTDGVVSVRSAAHPGCQSVLAFNAPHAQVHRELRTSCEVLRILALHAPAGSKPLQNRN